MHQSPFSHTDYIDEANYLAGMPSTASAVQANRVYWSVRTKLEYLIDNTDNPSVYAPAWRLVGEFGQKDLKDYLSGDDSALERLKVKVAQSVAQLP